MADEKEVKLVFDHDEGNLFNAIGIDKEDEDVINKRCSEFYKSLTHGVMQGEVDSRSKLVEFLYKNRNKPESQIVLSRVFMDWLEMVAEKMAYDALGEDEADSEEAISKTVH